MNLKKIVITLILIILPLKIFSISEVFAQSPSPSIPQVTISPESEAPVPSPSGQLISVVLKIPGIGGESGNQTPRNVVRKISIYLYSSVINAEDASTKPLRIIESNLTFDSDAQSATYGKFVNSSIDLGDKVPEGKYQIAVKAEQSLSKLIKLDSADISGKIYEIRGKYSSPIEIDAGDVLIGDIYPNIKGDNVMDINDYNELVSCFGTKAEGPSCRDFRNTDLDDDGKIDGVDYNLMFGSFKILLSLGKPVPSFFAPTPSLKPTSVIKKPTSTPVPEKTVMEEQPKGNGIGKIVLLIFIILFLILIIVFAIWKRQKAVDFFARMLHKNTEADANVVPVDAPEEKVDKEFFVKKQAEDKINNTLVLTLTDDNGPTLGYYSGKEVIDGFARIKGVMKKEGDKVFVDVAEIIPVEESA
ncbi:MAG TPA: hypothetical protein VM077_06205 [Candidatus Limnocylindrales bacterium]|nr:hypothetical protein [Candidatus Limnocylindrales bacterium]